MNAIVIEHVKVMELPAAWRTKLSVPADATVTVRIEQEAIDQDSQTPSELADDPLFGMWADREDMADVPAYVRKIRAARFSREVSPVDDGTEAPPRNRQG